MALRDFKDYYIKVQDQYLEMLADTKDFDEALKKGIVDQVQFDQAQSLLAKLKENYERLTYVAVLLNEPNRKNKKIKYRENNKNVYKALSTADSDYVIQEDADVLAEFKKILKGITK